MILSSLCDYYDILKSKGEALPEGYDLQRIDFRVCLSPDGEIVNIFELEPVANKLYPQEVSPSTGTRAYCIEYRSKYLFGLEFKNGKLSLDRKEKGEKDPHNDFVELSNRLYKDIASPLVKAFLNFVNSFIPEQEMENKYLLQIGSRFKRAKFDFCLSGKPNDVFEDDPQVKAKCEEEYKKRLSKEKLTMAVCSVYGEYLPIARIHNKIYGINGGQKSGYILVCFNSESDESYNKKQSDNSSVSRKAMLKYTEALNYLLKSPKHHTFIDNMTLVYFVNKIDEGKYSDVSDMFGGENEDVLQDEEQSQSDIEDNLDSTIKDVANGSKSDFSYYDNLDSNAKYYIFGMVPNSSRIAVKFSYVNTFGDLRKNLEKFNNDFAIGYKHITPKLPYIINQLKPSKSNDEADNNKAKKTKNPSHDNKENEKKEGGDVRSEITVKLIYSIINGTPFPQFIMQTLVHRIKTDSDTDKNHHLKMNNVRIGLLKACLNRICNNKEELITPMLNEQNQNPAYLCGRLFAVLEKIQQDSAEGKLNKTIKDAYFASVAATPAVIFPRLIKLSQNHLAKLSDGQRIYYNRLIGSIIANLPSFPNRLNLTEQSNFIIGYYQQNSFCIPKKELTEDN